MYRRIEVITENGKAGLCFCCYDAESMDIWVERLRGVGTGKNNRYFFTEKGWREIGRRVIGAMQRNGTRYRIVRVKHNTVDVMAGDDLEVAVRRRRRRERRDQR